MLDQSFKKFIAWIVSVVVLVSVANLAITLARTQNKEVDEGGQEVAEQESTPEPIQEKGPEWVSGSYGDVVFVFQLPKEGSVGGAPGVSRLDVRKADGYGGLLAGGVEIGWSQPMEEDGVTPLALDDVNAYNAWLVRNNWQVDGQRAFAGLTFDAYKSTDASVSDIVYVRQQQNGGLAGVIRVSVIGETGAAFAPTILDSLDFSPSKAQLDAATAY